MYGSPNSGAGPGATPREADAACPPVVPWSDAEVVARAYDRLRRIARARLLRDSMRGAVGSASLVHETLLRVGQQRSLAGADEARLIAAASHLMGQTLIDLARRHRAAKRDAGGAPLAIRSGDLLEQTPSVDAIEFADALGALAREHPEGARIIEMRFWGDLSLDEIAMVIGTSRRDVTSRLNHAKAWLARQLAGEGPKT